VIAFINSSTFTSFYANQIIFLILGIIEIGVVTTLVYSRHSGVMSIVYKMHKTRSSSGTAATATIISTISTSVFFVQSHNAV